MASYQDIDVRLSVVEDKIDLVMKSFQIVKQYESLLVPGQVIRETKSLLDVYRELKGQGREIINPTPTKDEIPMTEAAEKDGNS